jgi:hypothetical protein
MVDSGLSACQPPYFLPRAHTSAFCDISGAAGGTVTWGSGRRGSGCGAGRGRRGGMAGAAAGGGGAARRGVAALGEGFRDGPMSSSASRAGACTICGSALPSGRRASCRDGAGGVPEAGDRWTVTQPERAVTVTVTRSVAVVVVRCTRSTLLGRACLGERISEGCSTRVTFRSSDGCRRQQRAPAPGDSTSGGAVVRAAPCPCRRGACRTLSLSLSPWCASRELAGAVVRVSRSRRRGGACLTGSSARWWVPHRLVGAVVRGSPSHRRCVRCSQSPGGAVDPLPVGFA